MSILNWGDHAVKASKWYAKGMLERCKRELGAIIGALIIEGILGLCHTLHTNNWSGKILVFGILWVSLSIAINYGFNLAEEKAQPKK